MLYAIGDIHGELEKLDELLALLTIEPGDKLIFLGDYIDRGPDSPGVIERLIELRERHDCVFLLGNHESMFLDFLGWTDDAYGHRLDTYSGQIQVNGKWINYGLFLNTVISFLIVAFAVFLLIRAINKMKAAEPPAEPPATPEEIMLLREIRDSLKA